VLDNVFLVEWMLEELVLELSEEEQEDVSHIYEVHLQKAKTMRKNDVELHWLFGFIYMLCALLVLLMVHD
jgi:hypothetical protein